MGCTSFELDELSRTEMVEAIRASRSMFSDARSCQTYGLNMLTCIWPVAEYAHRVDWDKWTRFFGGPDLPVPHRLLAFRRCCLLGTQPCSDALLADPEQSLREAWTLNSRLLEELLPLASNASRRAGCFVSLSVLMLACQRATG